MLKSPATTPLLQKSQVYPNQLLSAFEYYQDKIAVLSLDCFDTLIWRNVETPQDTFYTLQHKSNFQAMHLTPLQRMIMEDKARGHVYFKKNTSEVNLQDIYRYIDSDISPDKINALIQEELETELAHCYALPSVVTLIRLAKLNNKKIIIVSDTYYSQRQLSYLLEKKLPFDVFKAIDKIYCSSDYGQSKSHGLFKHVIKDMNILPRAMLHIGDNPVADKISAQSLQIHALQLLHGDQNLEQLQTMRTWAAAFIDQSIRHQRPLYNPFKGLITNLNFEENLAEKLIGYASVGPIMYAFANFLRNEIINLQKLNKRVKILFLMRDAYLPAKACETLMQRKTGELIRISRFSTNAAAFIDKNAIEKYLSEVVHSKQFHDISRQLLLSKDTSDSFIQAAEKSANSVLTFSELIMQEKVVQAIMAASCAYRKRLFAYLRKEIDIQSGDTLVFVDLGYSATTQQKLSAILQAEFNVEVIGRYLISLPTPSLAFAKKGLLDISHYDERLLTMLVKYIAIFEQICTSHEKSVIDYTEDGMPIFSDTSIHLLQQHKTQLLQSECLAFVRDVEPFLQSTQNTLEASTLRDIAATELCRLMYLPTALEIDYLKAFQFDFNLGTATVLDVFDIDKGVAELRRQGLFFMEKNPRQMRTNYPAELRSASLELSFLLMSMERYKGKIIANDLSLRREKIPVILASPTQTIKDFVLALPTFDGYYSALIPLGSGQFQVGVQFGKIYRWVEIEGAHLIPTNAIYSPRSSELTRDVSEFLVFDQIEKKDISLYECVSEAGFIAFLPPSKFLIQDEVLRIIFRPIQNRRSH